ncbi:hypothetical protein H2203_002449 [Taxawa tesnikishii (nom. ined.)]|nr:hypothetical protein H2203_002449 [Dothideales sp. JES 119]
MSRVLNHLKLGQIKGVTEPGSSLLKFLGIPYGSIPQRFARSTLLTSLPSHSNVFDATKPGPSSIQPHESVKSDASGIPIPTDNLPDDEPQAEDCLNLSITLPASHVPQDGSSSAQSAKKKLPVLIFLHGGAFLLGSANRPYYSATNLLHHALKRDTPVLYVAVNYRLGALGFFHSPEAADLVPPNNGLHDQLVALDWIRDNIEGFGGDVNNVTILGQSAGGESISLHAASGMEKPLYKRAIMFSGSPVTMPAKTPKEHGENFYAQAEQLGIKTQDEEMIKTDVEKIRKLGFVGAPCTKSEMLPYDKPTMEMMRQGQKVKKNWVEAQIVSAATYDGGISYNMISGNDERKEHAQGFDHIAREVLGDDKGRELCDIYGITTSDADPEALRKICQFESDIGFFAGALSMAVGGTLPTYLQLFDLGNPFPGPLPQGEFATHTFDIISLLGGAHEDRLPSNYRPVVAEWRDTILDFVVSGKAPCTAFDNQNQSALIVNQKGVREVAGDVYLQVDGRRRARLFELAESVAGEAGWDKLWTEVS